MKRERISNKLRQEIHNKYAKRCAYCGRNLSGRWQIDHLIPVARGGTNEPDNLMPACCACNNLKHTYSLEQFRTEISKQVGRGRSYSINFRTAERFGLIQVIEKPVQFYFERTERPAVKE